MNRRSAIRTLLGAGAAAHFGRGWGAEPARAENRAFRTRELFDFDWKFALGDFEDAPSPSFDDSGWRPLDLPHDWSVEGPFDEANPSGNYGGWAPGGVGWYRKSFAAPALNPRTKALLLFDGIYRNGEVWINGQYLGKPSSPFLGSEYDLTPHLVDGVNVVAVRVENVDQPNWRWYSGSGIYRHAWLTITGAAHVALWGSYVTTPSIREDAAVVRLRTRIVNEEPGDADIILETRILDAVGQMVAGHFVTGLVEVGEQAEFEQEFTIPQPRLWSPERPALYTAYSIVRSGGPPVDEYLTPFGIRRIEFNGDDGFLLNGTPRKFQGVCLHQDIGCLGAGAGDRAIERRLRVLRAMGCNAVRTAHNPFSPEFLDLCDRLGFLVVAEAFDKWDTGFAAGFESPDFAANWRRDLQTMLDRDANHPSIVVWSVGNEAGLPGTSEHDTRLAELADFVRREEPTRPVTAALIPQIDGTIPEIVESVSKTARLVDVLALNYQEQWYERYRAVDASVVIIGSESYPYLRGIVDGFEPVNNWWDVAKNRYVTGQFVWAGVDYLGESAGWPSKGWPNGLVDTCGFEKARSFFHQSVWLERPFVRIGVTDPDARPDPGFVPWQWPPSVAHWTFPGGEGRVYAVETPSNADTVELIQNGLSLGEKKPADFPNRTVVWHVRYVPGFLQAIARKKGEAVAGDRISTAGPAARIELLPDRPSLAADGQDLCHIEVRLVDAGGVLVPNADREIRFAVDGPARLAGVDNGDLRSPESYRGLARSSFAGRCLAILRATRTPGQVVFTAEAEGVKGARLELGLA